ncbi:MAG: UDP-N-acetylglucosamine--N-acetylmuramyl-(pentapeptide) pyrophosphoryl-undecaprenol N-acetylglucosamine transferase [Cyanobacteriota bacterium]|nr:UDP-N-acetylglucosamine--N-acetylmuramyl-(pentapeptide) pyrophosphoryl-undecaprenol N-acetylglucosamine transferase [Cyanobacteriota bacterium]
MPRLLIAASGTGGHLFPALAVAEALPAHWDVHWLGVPDRLERQLVPSRYPLHTVRAGGLQGRGLRKLLNLLRLVSSTVAAKRLIRREGVTVVFTTGGYIAAPSILAARWSGVPVVLHESNAIPGRVTRLFGRFCSRVVLGFPEASERLGRCRPIVTGTPVRTPMLQSAPLPGWVPSGRGPLLLAMGGSQGALGLNRMLRPLLPRLVAAGCRVVLLTGSQDPEAAQPLSDALAAAVVERPFTEVEAMAGLLQHADLAISRSGAGALSELSVCRTPAILIPYPAAADRHQDANAAAAAAQGAAVIVQQHNPAEPILERAIWRLLGPRLRGAEAKADPLVSMAEGMARLATEDASRQLVLILDALSERSIPAAGPSADEGCRGGPAG